MIRRSVLRAFILVAPLALVAACAGQGKHDSVEPGDAVAVAPDAAPAATAAEMKHKKHADGGKQSAAPSEGEAKPGEKKHQPKGDQPFAAKDGKDKKEKKGEKGEKPGKGAKDGAQPGKKVALDPAGEELAAMRKKAQAMRDQLHAAETDRDLLKGRVRELEAKVADLERMLKAQK